MSDDPLESKLNDELKILQSALTDKTVPLFPRFYDLPWAHAVELANLDAFAAGDEPHCEAQAQTGSMFGTGYGGAPGVAEIHLVSCGLRSGHDGPHVSPGAKIPHHRNLYFGHLWEQGEPSARSG